MVALSRLKSSVIAACSSSSHKVVQNATYYLANMVCDLIGSRITSCGVFEGRIMCVRKLRYGSTFINIAYIKMFDYDLPTPSGGMR